MRNEHHQSGTAPDIVLLSGSHFRQLRVWAFATVMVLWTIALLMPIPHESAREILGSDSAKFWFAKSIHLSVYTFLTLFAGSFRLTRRERLLILLTLCTHAGATEFFQQFVNRGASFRDVLINHTGITLGVLLGWKWWKALFFAPQIPHE